MQRKDSSGRKPWIPPPGKSTSLRKASSLKSSDGFDSALERFPTYKSPNETFISSGTNIACKKYQEFRNDVEQMRAHYCSLQTCIQFLKGPFRSCQPEEPPAKALITEAISHLNSFSDTFGELTIHLDAFEKDLKEGLVHWIDLVERCQRSREEAFLKLFKAYGSTLLAFRLMLEIMNNADFLNSQWDQDSLRKNIETLRNQVTELEKDLAVSKEETKSIQWQKASVENENELLKQEVMEKLQNLQHLSRIETENESLKQETKEQSQSLQHYALVVGENECLKQELNELKEKMQFWQKQGFVEKEVEILKKESDVKTAWIEKLQCQIRMQEQSTTINASEFFKFVEGLKSQHNAEKEALRKAVLVQKQLADKGEGTVKDLEAKLSEKESGIHNLTIERDHWKENVTAIHNQLIEARSQIEELHMQNSSLETKFYDLENFREEELNNLNFAAQQKDEVIRKLQIDIESAKQSAKSWQKKFEDFEKERCTLNAHYEGLNKDLQLHREDIGKSLMEESKALVSVLEGIKQSYNITDKASEAGVLIGQKAKVEDDEITVIELLKDVKHHLGDAKEIFQRDFKKEFMTSLEKQKSEFEKQLEKEIEEKNKLQGKCEYLEKLVAKKEKISSNVLDNMQAFSKSYYRAFAVEATRSHDLYPDSSNNKSDQEKAEKKVRKLEKELQEKEMQLSVEKNSKSKVEKELKAELKQLEEKLSNIEVKYECLNRYVKNLKHSYRKIYGLPM